MSEHLDLICPSCEVRYKNEPIYNCTKCGYPLMSVEAHNRVALMIKREVARQLRELPQPKPTPRHELPQWRDLVIPAAIIMIVFIASAICVWLASRGSMPASTMAVNNPAPKPSPVIILRKQKAVPFPRK
jgi:hypothetical protein